jgi:hypothetical protein
MDNLPLTAWRGRSEPGQAVAVRLRGRCQISSHWLLASRQRRAMMASAPVTVHLMPESLRRWATIALHPASTDPSNCTSDYLLLGYVPGHGWPGPERGLDLSGEGDADRAGSSLAVGKVASHTGGARITPICALWSGKPGEGGTTSGGYRTSVLSCPSQHVTVIAVTEQSRDAVTVQVAVTATQDSVRAAKVAAVLSKRCRTVLTERSRSITHITRSLTAFPRRRLPQALQ